MKVDEAAQVEAAMALFAIAMEESWRPAVLANFVTLAAAARLVMEFPLPDEAEPAPVFHP